MTPDQIKQRTAESLESRAWCVYQNVLLNAAQSDPMRTQRSSTEWQQLAVQAVVEYVLRECMAMRVPDERPIGSQEFNAGWDAYHAAMLKETGNG